MTAVHESVLEAIGGTPLFRLARLGAALPAPVYAKAEFLSIGGSVKDRAALAMVERAERDGLLRPGGTIVESTSGNTGIGLAIVGRQRGYRVIVTVPDRAAQEKADILRAYGAEVVIAATSLPRQHPDHTANVAARLAAEIPGAWLANQYDNPANPDVHFRTTGPEIWEQTRGRVTHFVAGVGTGGTISGAGRYLKEVSGGRVRVIGADPESSRYSGGDGSPYYVESIGHYLHPETEQDVWPQSFHRDVVDRFEQVGDRESLLSARRLAREEGLLAGGSSGTAVAAALRVAAELSPDDLVVVLLPDSGRSYLSKVFSDDWLRRWGFLEEPRWPGDTEPTVRDALGQAGAVDIEKGLLVTVSSADTVADALAGLAGRDVPAVPVVLARRGRRNPVSDSEILGSVAPAALAAGLQAGTISPADRVTALMAARPPAVGIGQPARDAVQSLGDELNAAVVLADGRARCLVTREQLLAAALNPVS